MTDIIEETRATYAAAIAKQQGAEKELNEARAAYDAAMSETSKARHAHRCALDKLLDEAILAAGGTVASGEDN